MSRRCKTSFKHLSWFLLSIELSLSWLLFFRKNILRLRCSTNQIAFLQFNLRHKNRFTIYCFESRFHWIIHIGIFGIKNDKSFLISTPSKKLVGQEELESSTFAVSERHSNQLNYWPVYTFWSQAIVLLIPESSKRDIQTVALGWPLSCKWFSL